MPDQLSALYREFLEGGYDCVDQARAALAMAMSSSGEGGWTGSASVFIGATSQVGQASDNQ